MAKSPSEQIRDLVTDLKVLAERDDNRRREVEKLTAKVEVLQAELATARQETATLRQQLQDHIKQTDQSDLRRWGVVLALLAAVLGMASGLVIALVKK
jgi:predicted RNase H-like nuclease (RuvC/YqgF family)